MRIVDYVDGRGRKFRVHLPEDILEEEAHLGIPIGPPDVADSLGLPEEIGTRIHNMLFERGIFTLKDAQKRAPELQAAIQAALNLDVQTLMNAYKMSENTESELEVNYG